MYFLNLKNLRIHLNCIFKVLMDALDPTKKQKLAAQKRAKQILNRLGVSKDIKLNEYEMLIASQLVDPDSISVKFEDVAGLDQLIEELKQVSSSLVLHTY